jgi:similar to stage IV sporulation protein
MLLFKILSFLCGYVTITVPEECLEKFINMATARGIFLWGITATGANRVALKVRLSGVQPLRHVARMTRCRFKITGRAGLPFLISRLSRRKALLAGALVFVVTLYLLSTFVWFIEVTGNKRVETEAIEQAARRAGLYRGVPKWSLDTAEIEANIARQVPGLSWVGMQVDGTRVRIEVVEKVLPPDSGGEQKVDVVAAKDGLIKEILVLSGHPVVSEGDTVTAGQVLISAAIPPPENFYENEGGEQEEGAGEEPEDKQEPVQYVHARGIVRARVWYEGYGEMKLVERGTVLTGREITKLCIKIGAKEIILMGPGQVPYKFYGARTDVKRIPAWRNINIPVEFITVKYFEKEPYSRTYSRVEARRMAGKRALTGIKMQIPKSARILDQRVQVVETAEPEDIVRVRAIVETLEEIGVEKPHQFDRGGSGLVGGKRGSAGNHG